MVGVGSLYVGDVFIHKGRTYRVVRHDTTSVLVQHLGTREQIALEPDTLILECVCNECADEGCRECAALEQRFERLGLDNLYWRAYALGVKHGERDGAMSDCSVCERSAPTKEGIIDAGVFYCDQECRDETYDYGPDDDLIDGVGFADPGGVSALRAATASNPRNLPCPTCGAPNRLTPIDRQRGYQCDRCADLAERGGW